MLRISTKAALFEKLRSKREKETREKAFTLSIELHSLPSEMERERLRKESIRLFEYADRCGHKGWNDHLCYNRVTSWPFDFNYIASALTAIGMNPNDDLMPSEYQSSNFPDPEGEHPQPTQPNETDGPGSPKDQSELVVLPEIPRYTESIPPVVGEQSESVGELVTVGTTEGTPKRAVGRRPHAATVKYNELAAKDKNLSKLKLCEKFDKEGVPLPDMLLSRDNPSNSWIVAYGKDRQSVRAWLREKNRPPRARGKSKTR
jgi:hypothetical protein